MGQKAQSVTTPTPVDLSVRDIRSQNCGRMVTDSATVTMDSL